MGANGKADDMAKTASLDRSIAEHSQGSGSASTTIRQYSLAQILAVWAAAAVPMGVLSWVVAPLLSDQLGGAEPMVQALLILLTAGLVWQGVLVLMLLRHELGMLRWSRVREALWLQAPRSPRSGRTGWRVWLWALPFILLFALVQFVPGIAGPVTRDFGVFLEADRGQEFFRGAWGWYTVVIVLSIFNTVLGEELLFRGFLLPRMQGAFGKLDWVANGILFAVYHLHTPWVIPTALLDTFTLAYPSRRFQSAWMGIIVHSAQSVVITILLITVVLA